MDNKKEGLLLIATSMIVLIAFLITIFAVMFIYRKRKLQHVSEINEMNERFSAELLQTQLEVQRQTMQHIGREIHDNVGQKLTLAVLYVQQLETDMEKMEAIASIIHESLADLRSLSKSLTDERYLQTDLSRLIENECSRVNATKLCHTVFRSNQEKRLVSQPVKSFALRIVQECIQNSLKHAGCTEIVVHVQHEEAGIEISVADNGKGFSLNDEEPTGMGISNMKKRAEMIRAVFTIDSTPGKGTLMTLFIPHTD